MMKYLLVALVLMVAIGIWRNKHRKPAAPPQPARRNHQKTLEPMVTCAHCGLHLPASDAFTAPDAQQYCSSEHRRIGTR